MSVKAAIVFHGSKALRDRASGIELFLFNHETTRGEEFRQIDDCASVNIADRSGCARRRFSEAAE